ncbi:KR domain-containing protein, partial [Pyxidicoccus fallax]|nr:KR domain-containing protein [Pyxidicoccus fallax]
DWRGLCSGERRRRVVLPTYPFQHKRHWMEPRAEVPVRSVALERQKDPADWFYLPSWKRTVPPRAAVAAPLRWLVFADARGLGDALARRLTEAGHTVHTVRPGDDFRAADDGTYEVAPARAETYAALLAALTEGGARPDRVVHLWSVDDAGGALEDVESSQDAGFFSLLFLAQALGGQGAGGPVHLTVVSTGVQSITGHEPLQPAKATLLGACRVLPREVPGLTCQSLDVEPPEDGAALERAVARLLPEVLGPAADGAVALRGAWRWAQDFEQVRLDAPAADAAPRLRERGTYLITGGLGGIGLVLAEHLARRVQARLVLVARTALPEPAEWEGWLASHGEEDAVSRRIRQVRALEALGSEVRVFQADVADLARMEDVLRRARECFGELHGVIHAAGIPAGGLAQLRTRQAVGDVFGPKVRGTWVLHTLLRDTPLDFLLLCSSRTAFTAEPGQVDHCAACAFQDAFAHWRATQGGTPVVSLGWDTWREVGQAVSTALPDAARGMREGMLASALSSAEGVDVFERVLAQLPAHVVVSTQDLPAAIARSATFLQDLMGSSEPEAAQAPGAAPSNLDEVEGALADIWRRLLGIERVERHENFFDLGGNSLIGLKVIGEVKRRFGVALPVVALFENPTLGAMARMLAHPEQEAPKHADRRGRGAKRREQMQQRRQPGR